MVNPQEKVVLGVSLPAVPSRRLQASDGNEQEEGEEEPKLTFAWSGGGGQLDLAGDAEAAASWLLTSVTGRYLAFKPRALQPGQTYEFACTVSNGADETISKVCT
jgi:hypothetical protein